MSQLSLDERRDVVTAFLTRSNGKILLCKRSEDVRTYRNHWAGISGYLETRDPLLQAEIEIVEETGLTRDGFVLEKRGNPLAVDDEKNDRFWRVHPFRVRARDPKGIELDREHKSCEWVLPEALIERKTVPGLLACWKRVRNDE